VVPRKTTARNAGRDLLDPFEPFAAQAVLEIGEAGGVAAGPRQALRPTGADGVGNVDHHDRNAFDVTEVAKTFLECLPERCVLGLRPEPDVADPPHPLALLRARRDQPRCRRTTD
jgi:hypothetical protein